MPKMFSYARLHIQVFLIECSKPNRILTGSAVFRALIPFPSVQTPTEFFIRVLLKKVYVFYVPQSIHLFYPMILWIVLACINLRQQFHNLTISQFDNFTRLISNQIQLWLPEHNREQLE